MEQKEASPKTIGKPFQIAQNTKPKQNKQSMTRCDGAPYCDAVASVLSHSESMVLH